MAKDQSIPPHCRHLTTIRASDNDAEAQSLARLVAQLPPALTTLKLDDCYHETLVPVVKAALAPFPAEVERLNMCVYPIDDRIPGVDEEEEEDEGDDEDELLDSIPLTIMATCLPLANREL
ncbi:hypothetical protein GGF32_000079 [Allomyces javanicus]|nr:hypothetical protein GGF32_000079 [Allomyces javanicus]